MRRMPGSVANRFVNAAHRNAPRIAIYASSRFPLPQAAPAYEQCREIRRELNAELFIVHSQFGDLQWLAGPLGDLLPSGLCIRHLGRQLQAYTADRQHWITSSPADVEELTHDVGEAYGWAPERLEQSLDFKAGFTHARLAQALGIDAVLSWYPCDLSLNALVVARLLEIPSILVLHGHRPADYPRGLLSLQLKSADSVFASREAELGNIMNLPEAGKILFLDTDSNSPAISGLRRTADLLTRRAASVHRGFQAAFPAIVGTKPASWDRYARPFVVIAAERTGSNLLSELLSSHPRIDMNGELFNIAFMDDGYVPSIEPSLQRDAQLIDLRARNVPAFLERIWTSSRERTGRVGFKLLYSHGSANPGVLQYLRDNPWLDVIHLRRRNRLRRYVSQKRAEATAVWWQDKKTAASERAPMRPLEISVPAAVEDFEHVRLEEEKWEALLGDHVTLDLYYEDVIADFPGTAAQLCRFFELEQVELTSPSQPTGEQSLARAVANFEELRTSLAETPWSPYIDD